MVIMLEVCVHASMTILHDYVEVGKQINVILQQGDLSRLLAFVLGAGNLNMLRRSKEFFLMRLWMDCVGCVTTDLMEQLYYVPCQCLPLCGLC